MVEVHYLLRVAFLISLLCLTTHGWQSKAEDLRNQSLSVQLEKVLNKKQLSAFLELFKDSNISTLSDSYIKFLVDFPNAK